MYRMTKKFVGQTSVTLNKTNASIPDGAAKNIKKTNAENNSEK